MATKTTAPSPAPAPLTGQPITAFKTVWVHHRGVPEVQGRVGYVRVLKTLAATLIAAGHAQDPYAPGGMFKHITQAPAPAPTPAPSPAPSPTPAPPAPTPAPAPETTA